MPGPLKRFLNESRARARQRFALRRADWESDRCELVCVFATLIWGAGTVASGLFGMDFGEPASLTVRTLLRMHAPPMTVHFVGIIGVLACLNAFLQLCGHLFGPDYLRRRCAWWSGVLFCFLGVATLLKGSLTTMTGFDFLFAWLNMSVWYGLRTHATAHKAAHQVALSSQATAGRATVKKMQEHISDHARTEHDKHD